MRKRKGKKKKKKSNQKSSEKSCTHQPKMKRSTPSKTQMGKNGEKKKVNRVIENDGGASEVGQRSIDRRAPGI